MNDAPLPFCNVPDGAQVVAGYQIITKPRGGYTVRTPNGLRSVGDYGTLRQATMAAHAAAAVADAEQQRVVDEQSMAQARESARIARGHRLLTAPGGYDEVRR
jgi:hypothetical protein